MKLYNFYEVSMNLKQNVANWCVEKANALIELFPIQSKILIFLTFFLLLSIFFLSRRMRHFTNPEYPKLSTILRECASIQNAVSLALIAITFLYFLVLYLLVFVAYISIVNLSTIDFFNLISVPFHQIWQAMNPILPSLIAGSSLGTFTGLYIQFILIPDYEKGEGLSDVQDVAKIYKKLNGFNPTEYFNIEKGCFIGASLNKKCIYIPWKKIRETHIQVLGTTGSGKGVILTSIAYQAILAGECVIWFDPKLDLYSPSLMAEAAKLANKQFHFINLNLDQAPQLNPLVGANAYQIEELLVAAFDLIGKGTDGDFHRGKDEDAAILASKIAIKENALSIPELINVCKGVEEITAQENFWRKLQKLGDLDVINTKGGLNLEAAILNGEVIYIVGSTDNERVKMLQKLLLVRVNQIIKKKDRVKQKIPTCVLLDEFRNLLSPIALTSLSVIRGFNAHFILSHQSLGDLDSCAGITRAEAEGAVLDNTAIKIVYRIGDSQYAEKLSKNAGNKRIFVGNTSKSVDKNNQAQGGWKETNVPLIAPDLITHLPMPTDRPGQASVGVLLGVGVAKIFFTGNVPAESPAPVIKPAKPFSLQSNQLPKGDFDDII